MNQKILGNLHFYNKKIIFAQKNNHNDIYYNVIVGKGHQEGLVTTTPIMHCENCENKIKKGMRFVKGVKKIETSVPDQTVTITYDADKNSEEAIIKAFGKIGYKAEKVEKK